MENELFMELHRDLKKEFAFSLVQYNLFIIALMIIGLIINKKIRIRRVKKVDTKTIMKNDKSLFEFEKIYKKLYINYIQEFEYIRRKVRLLIIFRYISFFAAFACCFIMEINEETPSLYIGMFVAFFFTMFFLAKSKSANRDYSTKFKKIVIPNFIRLVDDRLDFRDILNKQNIIRNLYDEANFDEKNFNTFSSDDYITGTIDDLFLRIIDVHAQHITGSGKNRNVEELFNGIFSVIDIKEYIPTSVKISRNTLKLNGKNRVELDETKFEKYFDVYSEDRILATRILTSDVMGILVDYCEKYGIEFELILKDNNLYLRFFTGPMFEPKVSKSSMNKEVLYFYYSTLKFILEVTKSINNVLQDVEI